MDFNCKFTLQNADFFTHVDHNSLNLYQSEKYSQCKMYRKKKTKHTSICYIPRASSIRLTAVGTRNATKLTQTN